MREYSYRGYLPEVKQQISDMAMNGSGIRDTARVLKISPTTGTRGIKKKLVILSKSTLSCSNRCRKLLQSGMVVRVEEAEMDEMWSFVQSKKQQRWLWHAIAHHTGAVLAVLSSRPMKTLH